jgi:hypothetical protein
MFRSGAKGSRWLPAWDSRSLLDVLLALLDRPPLLGYRWCASLRGLVL